VDKTRNGGVVKIRCTKCGMEIDETKYGHVCIDKYGNFRCIMIPIVDNNPKSRVSELLGFTEALDREIELKQLDQQIEETCKVLWKYGDIL
jgi:hypothetical protein